MGALEPRLRRAQDVFPADIAGLFAECHLSHPERTDLVARVLAEDRRRLLEPGLCPESLLPFVRRWCTPADPLGALPAIDLAWDAGCEGAHLCPYFEPDLIRGHRAIEAEHRRRVARGEPRLALALGPTVLRALDPALPESWLERLSECVAALPEYGVLIPGRSERSRPGERASALRVIIALPRCSLAAYLERLRWPGKMSEAITRMDLLRPSSPWIGFDADIGAAGLGQRLGFWQEHPSVCSEDPELEETLERLASACVPARLRGLRAWVASQPRQPPIGQGRSLSLKLVSRGGEPPQLKAYLSTFDVAPAMRRSEESVRSSGARSGSWPS